MKVVAPICDAPWHTHYNPKYNFIKLPIITPYPWLLLTKFSKIDTNKQVSSLESNRGILLFP